MASLYFDLQHHLRSAPRCWLVTGGAGFIGSHLVENLLTLGQQVRVLDNHFSSTPANLEQVKTLVGEAAGGLEFLTGDIRDAATCAAAVVGVDQIIHLAALGSVPLSIEQPALCHEINVTGTLNLMLAAKASGISRFVYASSSAVYGDDPLPSKREDCLGRPLSPYAASKYIDEVYAATLRGCYGLETVGLRFFNVFGPRQDPKGAYAAVIPCWIAAMAQGEPVFINGDGGNTRDFCFVRDIVQALLLASTTPNEAAFGQAFNVGLGRATDLNELFDTLRTLVQEKTGRSVADVIYRAFRPGDIRHSCADTTKITQVLGFAPEFTVMEGLSQTVTAYH
jgi:UDP-N-acetylglucosamine/UDP-N-acetylgalactosamine 4-epimerase